jgi:hypothetical protein
MLAFFVFILGISAGGDVFIDYEDVCDGFVNLKMMCRFSLSEMLAGIKFVRVRS